MKFGAPSSLYAALSIVAVAYKAGKRDTQEQDGDTFRSERRTKICYRCHQTDHVIKTAATAIFKEQRPK
jgi:hypothetical protein